MTGECAVYKWKNKCRIITYTDPRCMDQDPLVGELIRKYPHICASNTLLQGMSARYKRKNFTYIMSIDKVIELLFKRQLDSAEQNLQLYIDISEQIERIQEDQGDTTVYQALKKNRNEMVETVKLLTFLGSNDELVSVTKEQRAFYETIYKPLAEKYQSRIKSIIANTKRKDFDHCLEQSLFPEVDYNIFDNQLDKKVKSIGELSLALNQVVQEQPNKARRAKEYLGVINRRKEFDNNTVVIHGVVRFTPEIMLLIETLDRLDINIIFLINYCSNLSRMYGIWENAYKWTGCSFENIKAIDLSAGNISGQNIALVSEGKRPTAPSTALLKTYETINDFTDRNIRREFEKAEVGNKNPLSKMQVQYYSVNAAKANNILKNYFPEQFTEKPFMSFPIGQFINGLFSMWNFDDMCLHIDFSALKECAAVKIAHTNENMLTVINQLQLYFKNLELVDQFEDRAMDLCKVLSSQGANSPNTYLSYYTVQEEDVKEFVCFLRKLEGLGRTIFGSDQNQKVNYKEKYHELITEVSKYAEENAALSKKESELIQTLLENLSIQTEDEISGSIRTLSDALHYFLQVKEKKAGANWIVRGFDQIDGLPMLRSTGKTCEFSMLSMSNMIQPERDVLPWPLTLDMFSEHSNTSVLLEQLKTNVEDRNDYLKFYLFYGAFFVKAQICFSYIKNEDNEKQRPYYLLELIKLINGNTAQKIIKGTYTYKVDALPSGKLDINITERARRVFSVCSYKYFLAFILHKGISYQSEFHTNYFIGNEAAKKVNSLVCKKKKKVNEALDLELKELKYLYPYLEKATLLDVKKHILRNYSLGDMSESFMQKKRDFLLAKWEDPDTKQPFMKFDKSKDDIISYLNSNDLLPTGADIPHGKICEECNFNGICMRCYVAREGVVG